MSAEDTFCFTGKATLPKELHAGSTNEKEVSPPHLPKPDEAAEICATSSAFSSIRKKETDREEQRNDGAPSMFRMTVWFLIVQEMSVKLTFCLIQPCMAKWLFQSSQDHLQE